MSKLITETDYYKSDNKTLPVKWSAPEAIQFGKFSTQSGINSFHSIFSLIKIVGHLELLVGKHLVMEW